MMTMEETLTFEPDRSADRPVAASHSSTSVTEVERLARLHILQRRAAEALLGPSGVFDPEDDQHRAALLLLCGTGTARELSAFTGMDHDFVRSAVRQFRSGFLWPFESRFGNTNSLGPCFDVLRAAQVGLGLAKRRFRSTGPEYEMSAAAWKNVDGLLRQWSMRREQGRRLRGKSLVCFLSGELSWPRRGKVAQVGGNLIFRARKDSAEPAIGQRCAVLLGDLVVWVRAERRMDAPTRFRVRLLGATDSRSTEKDALGTLRSLLGRGRRLRTWGTPPVDAAEWLATGESPSPRVPQPN